MKPPPTYTSVPDIATEFTPLFNPFSTMVMGEIHEVPSHLANLLAEFPPAEVNDPPANTSDPDIEIDLTTPLNPLL